MIVNVQQIQNGVINYMEQEIARQSVGVSKFGIYFMMPGIRNMVGQKILEYNKSEFFTELFDQNGNVKIDEVYNYAKEAIRKSGNVTIGNMIFNESDIDKLYQYITRS